MSHIYSDPLSSDFLPFLSDFAFGGYSSKQSPLANRLQDDIIGEKVTNFSIRSTLTQPTVQSKVPESEASKGTDKNVKSFPSLKTGCNLHKIAQESPFKEGYVYIFKAPKYFREKHKSGQEIVKIGKSTQITDRVSTLKKTCGIYDLEIIEDDQCISHRWYHMLGQLVQAEFERFNYKFTCQCKTEHREWFAVSETVALHAVRRWRKFIHEEPYDNNGRLLEHWRKRFDKMKAANWYAGNIEYDVWSQQLDEWLQEGIVTNPSRPQK